MLQARLCFFGTMASSDDAEPPITKKATTESDECSPLVKSEQSNSLWPSHISLYNPKLWAAAGVIVLVVLMVSDKSFKSSHTKNLHHEGSTYAKRIYHFFLNLQFCCDWRQLLSSFQHIRVQPESKKANNRS